jgi:hypothetical protein
MAANESSPDHVVVDIHEEAPLEQASRRRTATPSLLQGCDDEFFHQVVQDAGRWTFGVIFVEVWVLNETRTHLFHPENGWWIDPYAQESKFDPLTDPSSPDYLEVAPLAPGVGLPGALWAETHQRGNAATTNDNISNVLAREVNWREIKPLADDPDQPLNPRLKYLAECGLGLAAGIPFKVGAKEGLVVYMARENANVRKLTDPVNAEYLTHATLMIGSAYSLRVPRQAVVKARKSERDDAWRRVKTKLKVIRAMDKSLEDLVHEQSQQPSSKQQILGLRLGDAVAHRRMICTDSLNKVVEKIRMTARKCFGANVKAPPTFTWGQTAWTFFGAFSTLAILTNINDALLKNYGSEYGIVMG